MATNWPTNKQWILRKRPEGDIGADNLELIEAPIRDLEDDEVLIRNIYLSLDPTNRIWMSDQDQYLPPVEIGQVMRGGTIGVVEASRSARFKPGDLVNPGLGGWEAYSIGHEDRIQPVPSLPGVPLPAFMSVLGATGLTAYFGLLDIGKPQPGETVFVSGGAGAVGSVVAQIAKIKGCTVVASAGTDEKRRWLEETCSVSSPPCA